MSMAALGMLREGGRRASWASQRWDLGGPQAVSYTGVGMRRNGR